MTTGPKHYMIGNPAGANMTSTSNMTGAAGNTTGSNTTGAAGSSIPTTKPAGCSFLVINH
jgi:hypothetical protein